MTRRRRQPAEPPIPRATDATVRQQLEERLAARAMGFEELRRELGLDRRTLEEHLRHVERSAGGHGRRLLVEPARCRRCDFVFEGREARHLHAPSRCPACRGERIEPPTFELVDSAG